MKRRRDAATGDELFDLLFAVTRQAEIDATRGRAEAREWLSGWLDGSLQRAGRPAVDREPLTGAGGHVERLSSKP